MHSARHALSLRTPLTHLLLAVACGEDTETHSVLVPSVSVPGDAEQTHLPGNVQELIHGWQQGSLWTYTPSLRKAAKDRQSQTGNAPLYHHWRARKNSPSRAERLTRLSLWRTLFFWRRKENKSQAVLRTLHSQKGQEQTKLSSCCSLPHSELHSWQILQSFSRLARYSRERRLSV